MEVFQVLRTAPIPNVVPGAGRMHAKLMDHDLQPTSTVGKTNKMSIKFPNRTLLAVDLLDEWAMSQDVIQILILFHFQTWIQYLWSCSRFTHDSCRQWASMRPLLRVTLVILKTHDSSLQQLDNLTWFNGTFSLARVLKMARIVFWSASFLDL